VNVLVAFEQTRISETVQHTTQHSATSRHAIYYFFTPKQIVKRV